MALVVRNENVLFDDWRHSRSFQFGNHNIQIEQNWDGLGVAGVVWEAALSLSMYLWTHPEIVKNKQVLELGAGMGLCSIVISLLGSSIVSTDKADVLPLLRNNIFNNIPKFNESEFYSINAKCPSVYVEELDWFNPPKQLTDKPYDIIIGADLVYDVNLFPVLAGIFRQLINQNNFILLSTRIRYNKDEDFINSLEHKYGFIVENVYRCPQYNVIISKIYNSN